MAIDERTRPAAPGFCLRSGSESEDSGTREEHVVGNGRQEDGSSVRDQTPEGPVT